METEVEASSVTERTVWAEAEAEAAAVVVEVEVAAAVAAAAEEEAEEVARWKTIPKT